MVKVLRIGFTSLRSWLTSVVVPRASVVINVLLAVLIFACLWLFSSTLPGVSRENPWHDVVQNLVITIASLFPYLLYRFFIGSRRPILERDFRLNLQRLGLNSEDELFTQRFEAVFGAEDSLSQFVRGPLILVTIILLACWVFLFYQPIPVPSSKAVPFGPFQLNINPITLSFLGAYVFSLQLLYNRYVTNDLKPALFVSIATRVLVVLFVTVGLFVAIPDAEDSRLLHAVAFVVGIFPRAALRTLTQLAGKILRLTRAESFDESLPLSELDGINIDVELRLHDENIDNVEHMATADIVELFLQTRFPAERIIDWVDQALLQMHLGSSDVIKSYRNSYIRTASDLIDNYDIARRASAALQPSSALATASSVDVTLTLEQLRAHLGVADTKMQQPGALESLIIALARDPNIYSVRYWRGHEHEVLPRDANQLLLPGIVALLRGEPREAIHVYEEARRVQGQYPPISFYLGLAHNAAGRYQRAIEYFKDAIQLNDPSGIPSVSSYYYYLSRGRAHLALAGLYARPAIGPSLTSATRDGAAPPQSYQLAIDELKDAVADLSTATKVADHLAEGWLLLGEALAKDPQGCQEASEALQKAIDCDSARASPLTMLAFRHRAGVMAGFLNQYEEAATLLEEPVRDRRADTNLLLLLGELRFGLKQWDEAEHAFRSAHARDDVRPAVGIARVEVQRGQFDEAVADLQKLVRMQPNNGEVFWQLGQALLARVGKADATVEASTRDLTDAENALKLAVELKPDSTSALLDLGRVLVRQKRFGEAEALLSRAIALCPPEPRFGILTCPEDVFTAATAYAARLTATVTLGIALEARGNWSAAQDRYQNGANMSIPHFGLSPLAREEWNDLAARAIFNLGKILYEHNRKDADAEEAFASAARYAPHMGEAHEYQGLAMLTQACTFQSQGKMDEARQRYRELLSHTSEQLQHHGDLPLLHLLRGIALLETGEDLQRAESDLNAAREALATGNRPGWLAIAYFYLGRAQLGTNQPRAATESFRNATDSLNLVRRSPVALHDVYLWLARALQQSGDLEAAREAAGYAQLLGGAMPAEVQEELMQITASTPAPSAINSGS